MDYYGFMLNPQSHAAHSIDFVTIVAIIVLIIIIVFILQYAWNAVMPHLFGIRPISFWQALLLIIIAKILFGHC